MSAISSLVKDQREMFNKDEDEDGYEEKDDLNKDGIVTFREFGNVYLEILAK